MYTPTQCTKACCGNTICKACHKENHAAIKKQNEEKSAGKKLALTCPFCREPEPTCIDEEKAQIQARCLQNDHHALTLLGDDYRLGECGLPKDELKALDCYIRAVELGGADACVKIGVIYDDGNGVTVDKEKAALFERIGALRGDIKARHNIGVTEYNNHGGNHEIAVRHWKIAAEAGHQKSLDALKAIYNADGKVPGKEFISNEYLESTYRACHAAQMEVKSEEREKHSGTV